VLRCTVPESHFIIGVRFVNQISDFNTTAQGRWSVFTGLHHYDGPDAAREVIGREIGRLVEKISATGLNSYDIDSLLNIIPEFTKGSLSYFFNRNRNSSYIGELRVDEAQNITHIGYAKILPPGTEIIMGDIYNGTDAVQQICENHSFKPTDNCNITTVQAATAQ
jgi:hypothetical protein